MIDIKMKSDRAKKTLNKLLNRVNDMRPIWKDFIKYWQTDIMPKTWDTKGKTMGEQWKPLTPLYKKWKRKHGNKRLMELTSRLLKATQGGQGWTEKIEKKNLAIGVSGKEYFYYVQERKTNPRNYFFTKKGDMPNRAWGYLLKSVNEFLEEADDE
jgi:hypothetical protein